MAPQAPTTVAGPTSDRTARVVLRLLHVLTGVLLTVFALVAAASCGSVVWWALH